MDAVISFISNITQSAEQFRLMFILLVGGAVFMLAMGLVSIFNAVRDPIRQRLHSVDNPTNERTAQSLVEQDSKNPLAPYLLPSNEKEQSKVVADLVIAGFPGRSAVTTFYLLKVILAITFPTIFLIYTNASDPLPANKMAFYFLLSLAAGMFLPNYVLSKLVLRRQKRLRNGFPDALDLLVVCVESGLGLNAAMLRVAQELQASYPDLAGELSIVNAEIRAGVARGDALRNLAVRTGLSDIRGLVSLLTQSIRFGTSVADALRIYAEEFRDKRMQLAEEAAAKIGTKMIFPLVLCLFPSFFLVAVGPAILKIMEAFSNM